MYPKVLYISFHPSESFDHLSDLIHQKSERSFADSNLTYTESEDKKSLLIMLYSEL